MMYQNWIINFYQVSKHTQGEAQLVNSQPDEYIEPATLYLDRR